MIKDKEYLLDILVDIECVIECVDELTFDKAYKKLIGFNREDDLFDYIIDIDSETYVIGTIYNVNGMAHVDEDSYFEVWCENDMIDNFTLSELRERV